jgi:Ser/Thr protein kinase RdoA (MazF antagonist)
MDRLHLPGWLGGALAALARNRFAPIVALEPVTGGSCPAIRLTLADGTMLKAKQLPDAADALRVERLLQQIALLAFPVVRARHDAVIVTDWVPGRTLDTIVVDRDLLHRCGALHAAMHTRRVEPSPSPWQSPLARVRVQASLETLARAALISRTEVTDAMRIAERDAPAACAAGLVHGDINAENVVRDDAGSLAVVDNDTISIGSLAYDLARTWYRWPLSDAQWEAYLAGYEATRPADDLESHFPFWCIAVLARGAAFRLQAKRPQIEVPIARLRAQVEAWR